MKLDRKLLCVKVRERHPLKGDTPEAAILHVLCDRENCPLPNVMILGVGGELQDSGRAPLVIFKDGRGDYGSFNTGAGRFFHTNLRDRAMRRGELFSVEYRDENRPSHEEAMTFEIVEVVPLISGRAA
jgi:hypothetical protein